MIVENGRGGFETCPYWVGAGLKPARTG